MTTITIEREVLDEIVELFDSAITARFPHEILRDLRAALAAPATVPSPVAWMTDENPPRTASDYTKSNMPSASAASFSIPLYRIAPAIAPKQPSWHAAPTVPGVWLNSINQRALMLGEMNFMVWRETGARWFGPIPEDKP